MFNKRVRDTPGLVLNDFEPATVLMFRKPRRNTGNIAAFQSDSKTRKSVFFRKLDTKQGKWLASEKSENAKIPNSDLLALSLAPPIMEARGQKVTTRLELP